MAAGLLDIDVLALLHGPDGRQCVPVVGRGNGDRVDVGVFEQLADVLDVAGRRLHVLELGLLDLLVGIRVAIADGDEIDIGQLQPLADVRAPLAVDADDRDADLIVGANPTNGRRLVGPSRIGRKVAGGHRRDGSGDRLIEKRTAGELHEGGSITGALR